MRCAPLLLALDDIVHSSRDEVAGRALAGELGVQFSASLEESVKRADIVCACTHAETPVISHAWLRSGTHVSSVELGELISGLRPGRTSDDEITVFKSAGNAVEDAVAASLVLAKAAGEPGRGHALSL